MTRIARLRGIPIAPEYKEFWGLVVARDWDKTSSLYRFLRSRSYQFNGASPADPSIANELWEPAHEVYSAYDQFRKWGDPALLRRYAEGILTSMPQNSVYFCGTDSGRFVISAFCQGGNERTIFVVTPNALVNHVYLEYLQDLYAGELWLPSMSHLTEAFERWAKRSEQRRSPDIDFVHTNGTAIVIKSPAVLMAINGNLARMIFEANKDRHDFFVEEAYVIQWMLPYLQPHGLIMKLAKDPIKSLPDNAIQDDFSFWEDCLRELLSLATFRRSEAAQEAYSNMRSAIAGVYEYRGLFHEAETAFGQAVEICPTSRMATFRLAMLYVKRGDLGKARSLIAEYQRRIPADGKSGEFLRSLDEIERSPGKNEEMDTRDGAGR